MITIPGSIKFRRSTYCVGTSVYRRRFLIPFHTHVSNIVIAVSQGIDDLIYYENQFWSAIIINIEVPEVIAFQTELRIVNEQGGIINYPVHISTGTGSSRF